MKYLIWILAYSFSAFSLPVLNENIATGYKLTVYPDHKNKNVYYVIPRSVEIASDQAGIPQFLYQEMGGGLKKKALVQMIMVAEFDDVELKSMKALILKQNKNARFTSVPFTQSQLSKMGTLKGLVKEHDCERKAGVVGSEQSCSFLFNRQGTKIFRSTLKDHLSMTLQFLYEIEGVLLRADGQFQSARKSFGIAGKIGGGVLKTHPELFRDSAGEVIQF